MSPRCARAAPLSSGQRGDRRTSGVEFRRSPSVSTWATVPEAIDGFDRPTDEPADAGAGRSFDERTPGRRCAPDGDRGGGRRHDRAGGVRHGVGCGARRADTGAGPPGRPTGCGRQLDRAALLDGRQRPRAVHDGRHQRDGRGRLRRQPRHRRPGRPVRPSYGDDPALDLGDWVGAKVLHILPGDTAEELADLGPIDMGDPTTLSTFITYGITNFPAEHYALIISDHGAAWPGVGPDQGAGESMHGSARDPAGAADRPHRCRSSSASTCSASTPA